MKLALLGNGKTGNHVYNLAKEQNIEITIFNSKTKIDIKSLFGHDVIISFLPGDIFLSYIDILLESKTPVICGSTGLEIPKDLHKKLIENNIAWIFSFNFSLGMKIIKSCLKELSIAKKYYPKYNYKLTETHHTKKLDSPSGTAILWKKWVGDKMEISSIREGDVVGIHQLKLETPFEDITINHTAKDRSLFANGAIYAAKNIGNLKSGITWFEDL